MGVFSDSGRARVRVPHTPPQVLPPVIPAPHSQSSSPRCPATRHKTPQSHCLVWNQQTWLRCLEVHAQREKGRKILEEAEAVRTQQEGMLDTRRRDAEQIRKASDHMEATRRRAAEEELQALQERAEAVRVRDTEAVESYRRSRGLYIENVRARQAKEAETFERERRRNAKALQEMRQREDELLREIDRYRQEEEDAARSIEQHGGSARASRRRGGKSDGSTPSSSAPESPALRSPPRDSADQHRPNPGPGEADLVC